MSTSNTRGSLSHHQARHPVDSAKALDQLFEKVILGVLIAVGILAFCVYILSR
ncbi:MAG TPA: hypothetical protein VHM89_16380 [Acidimicrobiales bacterium]|nr:hypothetical protein [Acidimicrobiales bacterium]